MKHILRYFVLAVLCETGICLSMIPYTNASQSLLQKNNETPFQQHWVVTFPVQDNKGSQKRLISKSFIPVASKDVGTFLLEDARRETQCDMQKHFSIIRDHIDAEFGLNNDSWFRSIRGTRSSNEKANRLKAEEAICELGKIESLVPPVCYTGLFFEELGRRHQYVYRLIDILVDYETEKLDKIKGLTIDSLVDEERRIKDLSVGLSRYIIRIAKNRSLRWYYDEPSEQDLRLCENAFLSSRWSIENLNALKNSDVMNRLKKEEELTNSLRCMKKRIFWNHEVTLLLWEIEYRLQKLSCEENN